MGILSAAAAFAQLIPIQRDWGATIRAVGGQFPEGMSLPAALAEAWPGIEFKGELGRPYQLESDSGYIKLSHFRHSVRVGWPLSVWHQPIILQLEASEVNSTVNIGSSRYKSRFGYDDHQSQTAAQIDHHIKRLGIRWGATLRWRHLRARSYFDPEWEISWGEDVTARFTVILSQMTQLVSFRWQLEDDEIQGHLGVVRDQALYRIQFGEPFGTRMSLIGGDAGVRGLGGAADGRANVTPSGEWRMVGAFIEHSPETGLQWRAGGSHTTFSGEAMLDIGGRRVGEAIDLASSVDLWGAGLKSRMERGWVWHLAVEAGVLSGEMGGWIFYDGLPSAVMAVLGDDRLFRQNSRNRLYAARAGGVKISHFLSLSATGSWLYIMPNLSLKDFTPGDAVLRETGIGLRDAHLGWLTIVGRVSINKWSFEASASQMTVLDYRLKAGQSPNAGARLSGGWLASLRLAFAVMGAAPKGDEISSPSANIDAPPKVDR